MKSTMVRTATAVTAGILLLLASVPVLAQRVQEEVQVTVVEVPVTVTDRSGNPVRDLTKENFVLIDDGKRVPIDYLDMIDMKVMEDHPEEPMPAVVRRNFLILFDLSYSTPGTIERAREAAHAFVQDHLGRRDLGAVATFSVERGFRLVASFTNDRQLLMDAIATMGIPEYFKVGDPLFISATVRGGSSGTGEPGGASQGREGAASSIAEAVVEQAEDFNRVNQQYQEEYLRKRLAAQFENFGAVARNLDSVYGRKHVILLSEGFDPSLVQGRETSLSSGGGTAQMDAAMSGEVWKIDSDQTFGSAKSATQIREMGEIFKRSDVVLHAIDIKGVRSDMSARSGFGRNSHEGLYLITKPTGGEVFKNVNDLESAFKKMVDQQSVIYLLGFKAQTGSTPGKFHPLEVKLENVPRGTRASHRSGYHEPTGELSPLERTLSTAEILVNDIDPGEIALSIFTSPFPTGTPAHQVPVILDVPGQELLWGGKTGEAKGEIFIYAFDDNGVVRGFVHQEVTFDLSKVGETLRGSGFRYYGVLDLVPGDYAVKALVRNRETSRAGFARQDITVRPGDAAEVLSPMFLADAGDWLLIRQPESSETGREYPFAIGPTNFIPGTKPVLNNSEDYEVALFTYNVPVENLGLAASVRSSSGEVQTAPVSLKGRTPADEKGAVKLLFSFRPEDLSAGEYELQFTVKPADGPVRVVSSPFRVL